MEKEITLEDIARRLDALEKALSSLSAEKRPQAETISFEHIGGRKVGHPVLVQTEKEISFGHLGGRCIRSATEHPMAKKKDDSRE